MSSVDFSSLSIFPATREQTIESRKRSFVAWNRGLPLEHYLHRDASMDDDEHAREKLITWILAPRDDPKTLDFMCSCETFRRHAVLAKSTGEAPQVEEVIGYGIASVFTPESKRGKGYARHMMRLLHWVLSPSSSTAKFPSEWGLPPATLESVWNASFSVLYSDIGPTFYANCGPDATPGTGWINQGNVQTRWDIRANLSVPLSSVQWASLSLEQARQLYEDDTTILKEEVRTHAAAAPKGAVSFSFLPSNGVALFNVRRTMVIGTDLSVTLPVARWGIQLVPEGEHPAESAKGPFATWTLELRGQPKVLLVTRFRASQEMFPDLLRKLLDVAKEEDVDLLEIWNLPEELEGIAQTLGGVTATRDDHLPSFKWYGPESPNDVHWLYNEKFAWC